LDGDCTDKETDEIVGTLEHSLQQLFPTDIPVCTYGKCIDSGGGGTLETLDRVLDSKCLPSDRYLISSCTLHNLQTCIRNAVMDVMGEGGFDDDSKLIMNWLHMLHGA